MGTLAVVEFASNVNSRTCRTSTPPGSGEGPYGTTRAAYCILGFNPEAVIVRFEHCCGTEFSTKLNAKECVGSSDRIG
jgi:hypothetical protein